MYQLIKIYGVITFRLAKRFLRYATDDKTFFIHRRRIPKFYVSLRPQKQNV